MHHEVESCTDFQREFIEQACESDASFFVVESRVSGRSIDLKDLLTGKRLHVLEQSAGATASRRKLRSGSDWRRRSSRRT
jgi:hypothetical protein